MLLATINIFMRVWFKKAKEIRLFNLGDPAMWKLVCTGAIIGFLSGLIGIGGGIILSPLLLLAGWTDARQTAAISAPFIFVNSTGGLSVLMYRGVDFVASMPMLMGAVIIGGLIGAYGGSFKLPETIVRIALGVVLLIAGLKLVLI